MKKFLFALLTALVMFSACKTTVKGKNGVEYKTAVQYNDYIVDKQTELSTLMTQLINEADTDINKADQTLGRIVTKANQTVSDIEGMPDWNGDSSLRDKALPLFRFYKTMFADDYKRIIDMQKDNEVSAEEETEYNKIMQKIESTEDKLDKEFKLIQKDFATKNGFELAAESGTESKTDLKK